MTRPTMTGLLLVFLLGAAWPAGAATLRSVVDLRGSTVHLSDLFAGLDAGQDCALGDAPDPGGRVIIQQAQLEAIAAQFGVNWDMSRSEHSVTLARAGRTLTEAAVLPMVRAAMGSKPGTRHAILSLVGFRQQQIDLDAIVQVNDISVDSSQGRFEAVVTAQVDHRETFRVSVEGRVEQLISLPVLARSLRAGAIIDPGDLVMAEVPAGQIHGEIIDQSRDAIGMMSVHNMSPGIPIARIDIRRPDFVVRGGAILMRLSSAGIDVAAQGEALEAGSLADRVRVLNPVSHAVLVATVTGPNEVRVDPDSLPTLQTGLTAFGLSAHAGAGTSLAANLSTYGQMGDRR